VNVNHICEKEMSSASNEADVYYQAKVLKKPHFSGPLPVHADRNITCEYRECMTNGLFISCLQGDNCFAVDDDIGLVQNIIVCDAVYKQFTQSKSFFHAPLDSSILGIHTVSALSAVVKCASVSSIHKKFVLLPRDIDYIAIPLLHAGSLNIICQ